MALRMEVCSSRLADKGSSLKCHHLAGVHDSQGYTFAFRPKLTFQHLLLSTVLAQDHFSSDFLSLHLTSKTHKVSMMMVMGVDSKTSSTALAADLMSGRSPPGLNGINA